MLGIIKRRVKNEANKRPRMIWSLVVSCVAACMLSLKQPKKEGIKVNG